jgi:hypothetical protein
VFRRFVDLLVGRGVWSNVDWVTVVFGVDVASGPFRGVLGGR